MDIKNTVKELLDKCYAEAVQIIRDNREDMDKVVSYLIEKETITGAEMVAIIEGRDPELVDDAYASTRRQSTEGIEPAAKKVHMISQKIEAPQLPEDTAPENAPETPENVPETAPDTPEEPSKTEE